MGATAVHPGTPTYVAGGCASYMDFFLVENSVLPAVIASKTVPHQLIRKHIPVVLEMRGDYARDKVQVLRSPAKLPVDRPMGCEPPEVEYQHSPPQANQESLVIRIIPSRA